jgi:lactate dehydrogenase-like 2-hydroxyacid dehydrogenase
LRDAYAVMSCMVRIGAEVLEQAPQLQVVANVGVGYDNVDVDACTQRRILVTNTPDVLTEATADLAFALLLATARRIVEGDNYIRNGKWFQGQWNLLWGSELHGKTLGIYGFGRIGQAVARRGRGFSMRILYHSRHAVGNDVERELAAQWVDRETLMGESDFLSIHIPLTGDTRRSIGRRQLTLMKTTAFLINTARGGIIDECALIEALQQGKLAGAGLDVFEHEPKVNPALIAMRNVVLLPHVGSATAYTRLRMVLLAAENLLAVLGGKRPPNLVNPRVLD